MDAFAFEQQAAEIDVFLAGQSPLGEVLATPSAPRLEAVAVCLLDVQDEVRRRRLRARDGDRWDADAVDAFVGRWHRAHAVDPQARPEVIRAGGWPQMRWDRWARWRAGDARWSVAVVDTTDARPEAVGAEVVQWVSRSRRAAATGALELDPVSRTGG